MHTRRALLQIPLAAAAATASRGTALSLNEDNSHYFFTRAGQTFSAESVASFVDQYAGTQVRVVVAFVNPQVVGYVRGGSPGREYRVSNPYRSGDRLSTRPALL